MTEPLSRRALNRALLARQMLLRREHVGAAEATARLAGLNAQASPLPYVSLWSRLEAFAREELEQALRARTVVRALLMRSTQHLVAADDYPLVQPAVAPALARAFRAYYRELADRVDLAPIVEAARHHTLAEPLGLDALGALLEPLAPGGDAHGLAFGARAHLPLVQPPPAGTWRFAGTPRYLAAETWLGRPTADPEPATRHLVRRYLGAFGPATRRDAEAWAGVGGLQPVFDAVPDLVTFRDEAGRSLYDLPDAPRPAPDTPAPVRFLPEWDNLLLGHADRTRVFPEEHRPRVTQKGGRFRPTFLVDGFVAGAWRLERKGRRAALAVEPFVPLAGGVRDELVDEAERLLRWLEPDAAGREVGLV